MRLYINYNKMWILYQSNLHNCSLSWLVDMIQCFNIVLSLLNFCRYKTPHQARSRVCLSPLWQQWTTITLCHIPGPFRLSGASTKLALPQATSTTVRLSKTGFTSAKLRGYAELQPWIRRCAGHHWRGYHSAGLLRQWETHNGDFRSRQCFA